VSRRRKRRKAQEMAQLKESVYEDVTRLGEDISALNLNVMDPNLDPQAKEDYEKALGSYDQAKSAVDTAQKPEDMRKVTTALEDGRYFMTAVRARVDGRPVPERRAPCFFNPQHGPSVQDVSWAPPGGAPRSVPRVRPTRSVCCPVRNLTRVSSPSAVTSGRTGTRDRCTPRTPVGTTPASAAVTC
jgi:hypothetical protein